MARVFGVDAETGVVNLVDYDELTDTYTVIEVVDATALLENNKRLYNEAPARFGDGAVYASLDPVMRSKLMREGIIRTHTDKDPEPFRRWINDPDNRGWRVRPGKV